MRLLRYRRFGFGAAALVGALGAGAAFAQQPVPTYPECTKKPTPQDNELARNAHKLAIGYYDRADYDKAIEHWNEALKFDCTVNDLLINLSNAYEKKGDKAATIATLETYLKRTGPNPTLEEKVKNLKATLAPPTPSATATTAPTTTAPTPSTTTTTTAAPPTTDGPRPHGVTPWIVAGGGGAIAIAGAVMLGVGASQVSSAEADCPAPTHTGPKCTSSDVSTGNTGRTLEAAGGAVLGIGLAAAAAGLVWQLGFNKPAAGPAKTGRRNVWVSPTGGPRQSGVTVGGSF